MRVAIVSFELEGLTRNGGIGTAYRRLAELLSRAGHEVTVVFMPVESGAAGPLLARKIARLRRRGIAVVMPGAGMPGAGMPGAGVPEAARVRFPPGEIGYFLGRSHRVYQFLRSREFDIVHAPDNCGLVFVSLQAKKAGRAFRRTRFVIGAHGPRIWGDELNGKVGLPARIMSYFDQRSVELADCLVSPSRYMIDHLRSRGWRLPRDVRVIPNVNSLDRRRPLSRAKAQPRSLVFFGRLEPRKGVYLFTRAVRDLSKRGLAPSEVLFLGKDPDPRGKTVSRLKRRLGPLKQARFLTDLSSNESLELLERRPDALVCMPSLADNSPYVLVEALEKGLNFVCTRRGGQPELIHPADRARVLCEAEPASLGRALEARLKGGPVRARPSREAMNANREWLRLHARVLPAKPRPPRRPDRIPRISVVVSSLKALRSVLEQDYPNMEICLPKGHGWQPPARPGKRITFAEFDPLAPAVSRSACASASGKYVLFLSAPLARSSALSEWVAAFNGAPGSVGMCGVASLSDRSLSISPMALWDRRWLLETCKNPGVGLESERKLGRLHSRAVLSGQKIGVFPEVVLAL